MLVSLFYLPARRNLLEPKSLTCTFAFSTSALFIGEGSSSSGSAAGNVGGETGSDDEPLKKTPVSVDSVMKDVANFLRVLKQLAKDVSKVPTSIKICPWVVGANDMTTYQLSYQC